MCFDSGHKRYFWLGEEPAKPHFPLLAKLSLQALMQSGAN
jgi:hypothetical protein